MYSSKFSLRFLVQIKVEELIALAGQEHTGDKRQPKRPLIRLKVMFEILFSYFIIYYTRITHSSL